MRGESLMMADAVDASARLRSVETNCPMPIGRTGVARPIKLSPGHWYRRMGRI